ncbi:hypothetical protein [Paucihalobacter sp.]|uniref:hypothetical protein n=1 Tax=Paucihalobacter sp. TaxID=2850405 RepID=UPI002FDF22D2
MTTKNLISVLILVTLILFLGCSDCTTCEEKNKSLEQELKTTQEELSTIKANLSKEFQFYTKISEDYDFCADNEAVLSRYNNHNTLTGIANFSIVVPKGSELKLIKKNKNLLVYECNGTVKDEELWILPQTVGNLTQIKGDSLTIEVIFKNFYQRCKNEPTPIQEKKKTSVINGEPFVPNID